MEKGDQEAITKAEDNIAYSVKHIQEESDDNQEIAKELEGEVRRFEKV